MTDFYTDKKDIISWLDKYEVKNYALIPNNKYGFVVDVVGDVELAGKKLNFIPVKFNEVSGSFYCHNNKLSSLEFCPKSVLKNFYCCNNNLIYLEFCPSSVAGDFNCSNNNLINLDFCPQFVSGRFSCYKNSELKKVQKITKFNLIYNEHKKFKASELSKKLNFVLIPNQLQQNNNNFKRKL